MDAFAAPATARSAKRIFIVGSRRSGSTWLAMLLGQSQGVVVVQQSSFFHRLFRLLEGLAMDSNMGMTVLTRSDGPGQAARLSRRKVRDLYALERYREQLLPLAEDVYRHFAECHPEALAVVDQQPENLVYWQHIRALFPDAWFLQVVRDPRAVFASYLHASRSWSTREHFTRDPVEFAAEWKRDLEIGRAIAATTDRHTEVRFEQLRANGPEELLRLHTALGLPVDLEHCRNAIEACSIDKLRNSAHGPRGFFRHGEVAGWRRELSRSRVAAVEYGCGDQMDGLGYERVFPKTSRPPVLVRLWKLRRRLKVAGRKWLRDGDGWLRRLARRVGRICPPLRKLGAMLLGT